MTARHRHGEIIKFGHTAFGSGAIIHRLKECSLRLTREKYVNADVLLPTFLMMHIICLQMWAEPKQAPRTPGKNLLATAHEAQIWYKTYRAPEIEGCRSHCNEWITTLQCLCVLGHPASARSHAVINVLIIILIGQQSPPIHSFIYLRVRRLLATMDYGYLDEPGRRDWKKERERERDKRGLTMRGLSWWYVVLFGFFCVFLMSFTGILQ